MNISIFFVVITAISHLNNSMDKFYNQLMSTFGYLVTFEMVKIFILEFLWFLHFLVAEVLKSILIKLTILFLEQ